MRGRCKAFAPSAPQGMPAGTAGGPDFDHICIRSVAPEQLHSDITAQRCDEAPREQQSLRRGGAAAVCSLQFDAVCSMC